MDGIAAVGVARVLEVNDIELGRRRVRDIFRRTRDQPECGVLQKGVPAQGFIVHHFREVRELVVVHEHTVPLLHHLFNERVINRIRLAGAWASQYHSTPKRVYHVDPPVVYLLVVLILSRNVNRIRRVDEHVALFERLVDIILRPLERAKVPADHRDRPGAHRETQNRSRNIIRCSRLHRIKDKADQEHTPDQPPVHFPPLPHPHDMANHHQEEGPHFRAERRLEESTRPEAEHDPLERWVRQADRGEHRLSIVEDIHRKNHIGCDE